MPEADDAAPDFTLKDHDQNNVALSDYRGKKNAVLSFQVNSFTSG